MIWIIIIAVIIFGFVIFKKLDRDFILAIPQNKNNYILKFENGKEPLCKLMNEYEYGTDTYCVFVPIESLKAIPSEDIIILKCIKKSPEKLTCVFAEADRDKIIIENFYNKYKDKYNFILD